MNIIYITKLLKKYFFIVVVISRVTFEKRKDTVKQLLLITSGKVYNGTSPLNFE